MSVTFSKKYHTCSSCNDKGNELFAIKRNSDLLSGYPLSCRPYDLKGNGIYVEKLVRDDYGIIIERLAKEKPCEKCGALTLEADKVDNEENVLNFYPQSDAHKWLDGLAKAGV
jgi:hypothetical protein